LKKVDLKKRTLKEIRGLPVKIQSFPVYLAVSGGPDSTALAHVILSLKKHLGPIHWLHVNYHLRAPDSDREEEFLRQWAKKEGIPLHVKRVQPRRKPRNLQDWARRIRYDYFSKVIQSLSPGKGILMVAHHREDQAETILSRLMMGAGLKALGGMQVLEGRQNYFLFRPFLSVPKKALETYLGAHRLTYCLDRSNEGGSYLRNRIRLEIWPLLERENPQVASALIQMGERARQGGKYIEEDARRWRRRHQKNGSISRAALAAKPPILRQAVLEDWLRELLPSSRNLGRLVGAVDLALDSNRKMQGIPLPNKLSLEINNSTIGIKKRKSKNLRS
jgi:tRNA(Ile)-lysidine synthase